VSQQQLDRLLDARERARRVLLIGRQERARTARIGQAAAHEHLPQGAAHVQLALEALHVFGRAGRDLEAWRLHRASVRSAGDGNRAARAGGR
jgi:hypothetical protein